MKLFPAPAQPQRPDCAACSSARGAGVQFATDPIHGMRVKERDSLPATMQNRYRVGGIPFQQVPARAGDIGATVGAC